MDFIKWFPEFDGNRDKPKEKRVAIWLRPLSYEDMRQYQAMSRAWKDENKLGGVDDNSDEIVVDRIKKHVQRIENLTDLMSGVPIDTPEKLLEARGYWRLIPEIEMALIDISALKGGMEKNSVPPSDGSGKKSLNGGRAKSA